MAGKTLWVQFGKYGTYSISVPADRPVFEVHRIQGGINFEANRNARKTLTPKAYMLYMHLISLSPHRTWALIPSGIVKNTTLSEADLNPLLQELSNCGYWTPGEIFEDPSKEKIRFSCNSFHIWEDPSLNPNPSLSTSSVPLSERPAEN